MAIKYTNLNPKLPTREQMNVAIPRKIFLKRNIDYVTRTKRKPQGSFNTGNINDTIDLYQAIQTAIDRNWIIIAASGDTNIANTNLTADDDRTLALGSYDFAIGGDYATFNITNSGSGSINLTSTVAANDTARLSLSNGSEASLYLSIDANNTRRVSADDVYSLQLSGSEAGVAYSYGFPNVDPTLDGTPYIMTWTSGTPAFQTIPDAAEAEVQLLGVSVDSVENLDSPIASVVHGNRVRKIYLDDTVTGSSTYTSLSMPADMAVNGSGFPLYWNVKGHVHDATTNTSYPIHDSANSSVSLELINSTGPKIRITNGRANDVTFVIVFEYLKEA